MHFNENSTNVEITDLTHIIHKIKLLIKIIPTRGQGG